MTATILEDARYAKAIRVLDVAVVIAAIATLPLTVLELQGTTSPWMVALDWVIWLVFLADYAAMLIGPPEAGGFLGRRPLDPRNLRDARNWVSLVVLVLSFPLLPAIFQLVRLARVVKLARLGRLAAVGARGFSSTIGRRGILYVIAVVLVAIVIGGTLMSRIEPALVGSSVADGIWWAAMTTVSAGLATAQPETVEGRIVTMILLLSGVGLVAALGGSVAAYFIGEESGLRREARPRSEPDTDTPLLGPRFERAMEYAAQLHRTQLRKQTEIPYVSHLLGVASLVIEDGGNEDQAIAALLHDAVEDQGGPETLEDIEWNFGKRVASIVEACSDTDQVPKPPWRARKEAYLERLRAETDEGILRVSCADKLHNARSTLRDLRVTGPSVWARFNAGREDQLWYYGSLVAIFQSQFDSSMVDELVLVVRDIKDELPD